MNKLLKSLFTGLLKKNNCSIICCSLIFCSLNLHSQCPTSFTDSYTGQSIGDGDCSISSGSSFQGYLSFRAHANFPPNYDCCHPDGEIDINGNFCFNIFSKCSLNPGKPACTYLLSTSSIEIYECPKNQTFPCGCIKVTGILATVSNVCLISNSGIYANLAANNPDEVNNRYYIISNTWFRTSCPVGINPACGLISNGACSLPVELLSFIVEEKDKKAILNWKTASEVNNKHFIIEKSKDGKTFHEIA